jgi:hypothetical protein
VGSEIGSGIDIPEVGVNADAARVRDFAVARVRRGGALAGRAGWWILSEPHPRSFCCRLVWRGPGARCGRQRGLPAASKRAEDALVRGHVLGLGLARRWRRYLWQLGRGKSLPCSCADGSCVKRSVSSKFQKLCGAQGRNLVHGAGLRRRVRVKARRQQRAQRADEVSCRRGGCDGQEAQRQGGRGRRRVVEQLPGVYMARWRPVRGRVAGGQDARQGQVCRD